MAGRSDRASQRTGPGVRLWLETPAKGESREAAWKLGRTVLRRLLGSEATIERSPNGKPFINGTALHFSLSHAPRLVALCVCAEREVGVDVESFASGARVLRMAEEVLSPAERAALAEGDARRATELWTLKEAYVKAYGTTLGAVDPATLTFQWRRGRPSLVAGGKGPAVARTFHHAGHAVAVVAVGSAPIRVRIAGASCLAVRDGS